MTRTRLSEQVKQSLLEQGLISRDDFEDEERRQFAHAVIDATLDYVIEFGLTVSQELVGVGLYSESMIAGLFIRKMKQLKNRELG